MLAGSRNNPLYRIVIILGLVSLLAVLSCESRPPPSKDAQPVSPGEAHEHASKALNQATSEAKQAATHAAKNNRRVLVTIDDLPLAMYDDYRSRAERRETVARLTDKLDARGIPLVGFFNMSNHARDPSLTEMWAGVDALRVGNHTWSHPHIKRTPVDRYIADLERGHDAVRPLVDDDRDVPFRYPYLARGFDPEVRDAIRARLAELDSPVIPVTINTMDWYYARDYLDAIHADDKARAADLRRVWLADIQEETIVAEQLSRALFDRLPPQILLLHANRLNADYIDDALDWYERRGYAFVTLEEAMADAAYDTPVETTARVGLDRWRLLLREREGGGADR
jgi:peptidoglycan/xylan/chitin deacetylase (PgdA/CDA1 family)